MLHVSYKTLPTSFLAALFRKPAQLVLWCVARVRVHARALKQEKESLVRTPCPRNHTQHAPHPPLRPHSPITRTITTPPTSRPFSHHLQPHKPRSFVSFRDIFVHV